MRWPGNLGTEGCPQQKPGHREESEDDMQGAADTYGPETHRLRPTEAEAGREAGSVPPGGVKWGLVPGSRSRESCECEMLLSPQMNSALFLKPG